MSRRVNFHLTDEQLAEIEQAINGSPYPEVRQRAIAMRLLHMGQSPEQVAEIVMVGPSTVWTWHRRYRAEGVAGLRDKSRSGRPSKADEAYIERLHAVMETDPRQLGLPFNIWTINRLRLYLAEQTNILLSFSRFRALLSRLGYRWKEPKHALDHLQDKPAQATIGEVLDWLKKTSPSTPSPKPSYSLWTRRP
ncbi:MAG: transposase [Chloroflexi bacterium]|nr:transposase [Chloroflexota bacterium]NOG66546.1 transposase [Chloroflexota bacterium]GIK30441.1 MAG: hypothetical protein BroJett007_35790 [Chloroflexota bacterium]